MTREEIFALVEKELQNAVKKHGPTFSDHKEMYGVIADELCEVGDALCRRDYNGPHGLKIELAQVAAACIKALEGLE